MSQMGPKDHKDLSDTNGNSNASAKGKDRMKKTRSPSTISLRNMTDEDIDDGIAAIQQMAKILPWVQQNHGEIEDANRLYGLCIKQQDRITHLESTLDDLSCRQDRELRRLQDENEEHLKNASQIEREREQLEKEKASNDDTRLAMKAGMERQKEEEIEATKQVLSEKFKAKVKEVKEPYEKKIQALEEEKHRLEDRNKTLKNKLSAAEKKNGQEKEEDRIVKKSLQSHIKDLELELDQIKSLSTVSPKEPDF